MKLLFATDGIFPDSIGGKQRHAYFLVKYLSKFDIEIDVLEPEGSSKHFQDLPNVKEFFVERSSYYFPGHYLFEIFQYSRNVSKFINKRKYDVGYSEGYTLLDYVKRKKFPCIFNPHGLEMFQTRVRYSSLFKKIVSYMGKYSDITISLGGKLTDILVEKANVKFSKIRTIPNAVDPEYIKNCNKSGDKIPNSFLFVGRLSYNKGVDLLINVFNKKRDTKLFIIGSGPQRASLEKLARNANITFLGRVSEKDLINWYNKVECFIFPSLGEGMPSVILEAMANRLPIIASDIGAVSTMVNCGNGYLIKPGSMNALGVAIQDFTKKSKQEKKRMGEESYKLADREFSWKQIAKKTYRVLEHAK
jgi:glycosyltransferase involved in cell wall biosynthesis